MKTKRYLCVFLICIAAVAVLPHGAIADGNVLLKVQPGSTTLWKTTLIPKNIGYTDYSTGIAAGSGKTVFPASTGSISVASTPPGATVFIDGKNRGTTPATLSGISTGTHTIVLNMSGYKDYLVSVSVSAGKTATVAATLQQAPAQITWVSTPPANTPGEAILAGAKALMKGIYTLSPGSPDYLPGSYSNENIQATKYAIHSSQSGQVVWPASGQNQVAWKSVPWTSPKGWSGKVVSAGAVGTGGTPQGVSVNTDCSGFITSLFAYANTRQTTGFTNWTAGSLIPEAGCFDPLGARSKPNPLNYYSLFVTGQNGWFTSVALSDLQPGDIIAYANTKNTNDTGHIMLVAAVSSGQDNSKSRNVVVIDETGSVHSSDTRHVTTLPSGQKQGAGIGMGYVKLATSQNGTLQFFWGLTSPGPEIGSVALGRAL